MVCTLLEEMGSRADQWTFGGGACLACAASIAREFLSVEIAAARPFRSQVFRFVHMHLIINELAAKVKHIAVVNDIKVFPLSMITLIWVVVDEAWSAVYLLGSRGPGYSGLFCGGIQLLSHSPILSQVFNAFQNNLRHHTWSIYRI
jgi:hypothetical protein